MGADLRVPQVRASDLHPSALEKCSRTERALDLPLADLTPEAAAFILARIRAAGGKVR